jgi:hypothetical protein
MKLVKVLGIAAIVYVGIVVAFESAIGVLQPQSGATLVITTFGADGDKHDRVVSRLESAGKLYVAANHWPRAWYERALANPEVQATIDGQQSDYTAMRVEGVEYDQVNGAHALPLVFRLVTGFPPRKLVRLDPR